MFIGFDLDGTLLDSRPRHIEVLRHVWPQVDQVLSDQWVHRFWECKDYALITAILTTHHPSNSLYNASFECCRMLIIDGNNSGAALRLWNVCTKALPLAKVGKSFSW